MNIAAHHERDVHSIRSWEDFMRALLLAAAMTATVAGPAFAQNAQAAQTERGYISGIGGFAVTPDATSGDVVAEAGVRIAPHLLVFGNIGQFHNLQPSDIQPAIETTTTFLSAGLGLNVVGIARVPAWYSVGGLRYELPAQRHVSPYVLGGLGFARLTPTAKFTYTSGTLPDGTIPSSGADVTSQLESAGDFTMPLATNAFMFTLGGGVGVPFNRHWSVDAGYRFSRIDSDVPVNAQGATFGLGYRF
jgi:opacity protein-like surface antigen